MVLPARKHVFMIDVLKMGAHPGMHYSFNTFEREGRIDSGL